MVLGNVKLNEKYLLQKLTSKEDDFDVWNLQCIFFTQRKRHRTVLGQFSLWIWTIYFYTRHTSIKFACVWHEIALWTKWQMQNFPNIFHFSLSWCFDISTAKQNRHFPCAHAIHMLTETISENAHILDGEANIDNSEKPNRWKNDLSMWKVVSIRRSLVHWIGQRQIIITIISVQWRTDGRTYAFYFCSKKKSKQNREIPSAQRCRAIINII